MTTNYNSGFVTSIIKSRAMLGGCVCTSAGGGGVTSINNEAGPITIVGTGGTTVTNIGPAFTVNSTGTLSYEWSEHPAVQDVNIANFDMYGIVSFNNVSASFNSPTNVVGLGNNVLSANGGTDVAAFGNKAASNNQGSNVNAIGFESAVSNTGNNVVAIGANAAFNNSGNNVIAIGNQAAYNMKTLDIPLLPLLNINAIGRETCLSAICRGAIDAIGYRVGLSSSIRDSVLIGKDTGRNGNYSSSVLAGCNVGESSVVSDSVVIGCNAGSNNYIVKSVVIGCNAGSNSPTGLYNSVCVGEYASGNGESLTSIGYGSFGNGSNIVSIGQQAGRTSLSGFYKIHIGDSAGGGDPSFFSPVTQNRNVIAIGDPVRSAFIPDSRAGYYNTGSYTTAIGGGAGCCNTGNNCIFLGTNPTFDKIPNVMPETTTADNRFLVYSTHQGRPFLYGDLSMNKLCVGNSNFVANANLNVSGSAYFTGELYDSTYSAGTPGQILTTTGTSTAWADSPTSIFASFLSMTTQNSTISPVSTAITYSERTVGTIDVFGGTYPNSQIVIPVAGTYKVVFSVQCDVIGGGNHDLEIFPVINGLSVPKSNTKIQLGNGAESCLTVEYILSFTANQILEFNMTSDSTTARIVAITRGGGTPVIPDIPSIIVTIMRIA